MKSNNYSKIQEILAAQPDDARLLADAGLIDEAAVEDAKAQQTMGSLAVKYYDLAKVKAEILEELGAFQLKDLEFEPGRYEYSYDYLGSLETACRTMGLSELGIEETDAGYKLGEQEAGSIEELEFAEDVLTEFADKVAQDLKERIEMPGTFYFGFNSDWGEGFRLFYAFEDSDIPQLQEMGSRIQNPNQPSEQPAEASFDEILAALEVEGCHDIAIRLHSILREN